MIIYLPGNAPINKVELESFSKVFSENEREHIAHEWDHWADETKQFDLEKELDNVISKFEEKGNPEDYGVVAKSIGTFAAAHLIERMEKKPSFVILMGVPTNYIEREDNIYRQALGDLDIPIYIISNEKDPYSDIDSIKENLGSTNYEVIIKPREDHIYDIADEVWDLIEDMENEDQE